MALAYLGRPWVEATNWDIRKWAIVSFGSLSTKLYPCGCLSYSLGYWASVSVSQERMYFEFQVCLYNSLKNGPRALHLRGARQVCPWRVMNRIRGTAPLAKGSLLHTKMAMLGLYDGYRVSASFA